jgi:predicted O-methyltransferase YrrM
MNLLDYLFELESLQQIHPIIIEMENYGKKMNFPILNRLSARFLSLISIANKSKYVFEIGSGFGYSAMWIALYNQYLEKIYLTDYRSQNLELARQFFGVVGLEDKIEIYVGDGLNLLSEIKMEFDLIFNDADKKQYPKIISMVKKKLKVGGVFISDNTLWHNKVLDKNDNSEETKAIREFNRLIFSDNDFISSFLPIGDGLIISIKTL